MERPPVDSASLRARVLGGLAWKLASQLFGQVARFAVALVLARLLAPHDYGLAGMALVFSGLALVFSDFALGAALVQRRELTEEHRSTVFWTSLAAGAACTGLGVALAGPIAAFYGEPRVRGLFVVLSLGFVVTSLGSTQSALLTRELRFRSVEVAAMAGTAVGAAVGIGLAVAGYGPWALIGQSLAAGGVSTVSLWLFSTWRPRLVFSPAGLRELGGFGGRLLVTRVLFYVHRNADNLLVGRFLGAAPLGAYALAYNLVLAPFGRIVDPIRGVLFPAFSRLQDEPERLAGIWLRVTRLIAAFFLPAMLGLTVVAPDFVRVVLGARWEDAIPVVQILAWVGLLQSVAALNSVVLPALDRTGTLLRFSIVTVVASLAGFVAGLHWGIVGVAIGYLAANLLVVPLYTQLTARALGVSLGEFARVLAGVAEASLAMFAGVLTLRLLLVGSDVAAGVRLALAVVAGLAIFLPLCAWRAPEVLGELSRIRRDIGSRGVVGAQPSRP